MPEENGTQNPQAVEPTTDPAPVNDPAVNTEDPATSKSVDPQVSNSDPVGTEPIADPQQPESDSKMLRELKTTRKRAQEAELEIARLRGMQEAQQKKQQPIVHNGPPTEDQYENWEDFVKASTKYEIREEFKQEQQMQKMQDVNVEHQKRMASVYASDQEKFNKISTLQITPDAANVIKSMKSGIDVAAFLADNPDSLARVNVGGPGAYLELGKIEARLMTPREQPQTRKISQVPDPLIPVNSGSGTIKKTFGEMSMDEYSRYRDKQIYGTL